MKDYSDLTQTVEKLFERCDLLEKKFEDNFIPIESLHKENLENIDQQFMKDEFAFERKKLDFLEAKSMEAWRNRDQSKENVTLLEFLKRQKLVLHLEIEEVYKGEKDALVTNYNNKINEENNRFEKDKILFNESLKKFQDDLDIKKNLIRTEIAEFEGILFERQAMEEQCEFDIKECQFSYRMSREKLEGVERKQLVAKQSEKLFPIWEKQVRQNETTLSFPEFEKQNDKGEINVEIENKKKKYDDEEQSAIEEINRQYKKMYPSTSEKEQEIKNFFQLLSEELLYKDPNLDLSFPIDGEFLSSIPNNSLNAFRIKSDNSNSRLNLSTNPVGKQVNPPNRYDLSLYASKKSSSYSNYENFKDLPHHNIANKNHNWHLNPSDDPSNLSEVDKTPYSSTPSEEFGEHEIIKAEETNENYIEQETQEISMVKYNPQPALPLSSFDQKIINCLESDPTITFIIKNIDAVVGELDNFSEDIFQKICASLANFTPTYSRYLQTFWDLLLEKSKSLQNPASCHEKYLNALFFSLQKMCDSGSEIIKLDANANDGFRRKRLALLKIINSISESKYQEAKKIFPENISSNFYEEFMSLLEQGNGQAISKNWGDNRSSLLSTMKKINEDQLYNLVFKSLTLTINCTVFVESFYKSITQDAQLVYRPGFQSAITSAINALSNELKEVEKEKGKYKSRSKEYSPLRLRQKELKGRLGMLNPSPDPVNEIENSQSPIQRLGLFGSNNNSPTNLTKRHSDADIEEEQFNGDNKKKVKS